MSIQIDVTKKYIPEDALRLIADYLLVKKASTEQMESLERRLRQTGWVCYQEGKQLLSFFRWEQPSSLIKHLVPIMTNKLYKSEGCDFPSAEIFADIAYVILGLPRPEKKLNQIFVAKEIVDFIHNQPYY